MCVIITHNSLVIMIYCTACLCPSPPADLDPDPQPASDSLLDTQTTGETICFIPINVILVARKYL